MTLMQVFDPPMCCSTGVCGPHVDAALTQFSSDLEWLESQGVEVRRYNLAQEPGVFVDHALVKSALAKSGEKCLPLILVDGEIVAEGAYPSREELAVLVSVATDSLYSAPWRNWWRSVPPSAQIANRALRIIFAKPGKRASVATISRWRCPRPARSKRLRRARSPKWPVAI